MKSWFRKILASGLSACVLSNALGADPLQTNRTKFNIPFTIDQNDSRSENGEAMLFMSVDGGDMSHVQTVRSSRKKFPFQAATDGLYEFTVRLTDAAGQPLGQQGPLVPDIAIEVDTVAPELSFRLSESAPGEITVHWNCSESKVSPGSLRLEYAEGSDGRWQQIVATPGASGKTTIKSKIGTAVSVRGFISDLAGNQGTGSSQIVLNMQSEQVTSARPGQAVPANPVGPTPFANNQRQPFGVSIPEPLQSTTPLGTVNISPSINDRPVLPPLVQPQPTISANQDLNSRQAASQTSTVGNSVPYPMLPMPGDNAASIAARQPASSPQSLSASNSMPYGMPAPSVISGPQGGQLQSMPSTGFSNSFPADNFQTASTQPYRMPQQNSLPPSNLPGQRFTNNFQSTANHQLVGNSIFNIDYQVDDVGPSGVSAVELFVTEDNGQNWFAYGNDMDLRSPFQVDTQGEGTFGFAVRVRNGLGFRESPPQPGDLPSIVVTVDKTGPVAEFGQPQVTMSGGAQVRLAWRITEDNPSRTPVRLEYSGNQNGPWVPAFDWKADTGNFNMPVKAGMPMALHFRLLTRDSAGNITATQTTQPVLVDQMKPTARLLRIQPVSSGQRM